MNTGTHCSWLLRYTPDAASVCVSAFALGILKPPHGLISFQILNSWAFGSTVEQQTVGGTQRTENTSTETIEARSPLTFKCQEDQRQQQQQLHHRGHPDRGQRGGGVSQQCTHRHTHIHRQDRSGNPQSINTPKTSQLWLKVASCLSEGWAVWVGPPLALLLAQQQEKAHISSSLFVRLSVFEHLELPEGRIRPGLRFRPLCSTIYVPWHTLRSPYWHCAHHTM